MWLILCERNDPVALWVYKGLNERGVAPLEIICPDTLVDNVIWEHRLEPDKITTDFTLSDGRKVTSSNIQGVINRFIDVGNEHLTFMPYAEQNYIMHEMTAFFISWLYSLPYPVLNRPTPQGLSGYSRHFSEWVWLAARAGLPTADYIYTDYHHPAIESGYTLPDCKIFVIDGHVAGESTPPGIQKGCLRLAELAKTALLEISFVVRPGGVWIFTGATPFPDLRYGGNPLLDILAMVLKNKPGLTE